MFLRDNFPRSIICAERRPCPLFGIPQVSLQPLCGCPHQKQLGAGACSLLPTVSAGHPYPLQQLLLILRRWFSSRGSFPSRVFTFGKGRHLWLSQWGEGWGEAVLRAPTQRTEARAGMRLNTLPHTEQPHRRAVPSPKRQQCSSCGAPF